MAVVTAFGAGLLFGIGLWLSGMAYPRKVLDFLDVTGNWDPSLLVVMAGAVAVTFAMFRPLIKLKQISFDRNRVDFPLVAGAILFGIGWGIGGYCPGPALTALSTLGTQAIVFVATMIAGGVLARILLPRSGA